MYLEWAWQAIKGNLLIAGSGFLDKGYQMVPWSLVLDFFSKTFWASTLIDSDYFVRANFGNIISKVTPGLCKGQKISKSILITFNSSKTNTEKNP